MTLLYSILFLLLMLVDWSQTSLNGGIWAMTVNCIGLILCVLIGSLLSWNKRPGKVYLIWLGVWFVGAITAFCIWKMDINNVLEGQFITALLNIAAIGILVIKYWQEGIFQKFFLKIRHKNIFFICLWIALTLWMCLSPQRSIWHIWFFVLFSLFYILPVSRVQKNRIVNGVLNGIILGFFVLQILAYGFRPYDMVRYRGFFSNCNYNALMYLVTYCAVLTRILFWEKKEKGPLRRWCLLFFYVLAGGLLGFSLMTMTRTALIMDTVVTICFLGVLLYRYVLEKKRLLKMVHGIVSRGIVIVGLSVLLFPAVFLTVRYLPTILHHPIWFLDEYSIERVHSFDDYDSYKYIEIDEFLEEFCNRFSIAAPMRVHAEELAGDSAKMGNASGVIPESGAIRLEIYRLYLENLNLKGHALWEGFFQINDEYYSYHAHNVFVQMAFTYGIPAGIMFILLVIMIGVRTLGAVLKRPYDSWAIFRCLAYLVFLGYGMLEMTWNTGQLTLFLFYFVQKELETEDKLICTKEKING